MTDTTLGQIIDGLGVPWHDHDGDLISDAIVIAKVVAEDGGVSLRVANSAGMSWIEKVGMMRVAERMELTDLGSDNNWDDDE